MPPFLLRVPVPGLAHTVPKIIPFSCVSSSSPCHLASWWLLIGFKNKSQHFNRSASKKKAEKLSHWRIHATGDG